MNGDVVFCSVCNIDDQSVSIVNFQSGCRKLAIHCDYAVSLAQPLHWCLLNLLQSQMISKKTNL